uniref:Facilitated trehalose transporter Tret1 n=1 Tax=Lygus hesperus TaxID=30085 RepID=A0A0A9XL62_LYGHE
MRPTYKKCPEAESEELLPLQNGRTCPTRVPATSEPSFTTVNERGDQQPQRIVAHQRRQREPPSELASATSSSTSVSSTAPLLRHHQTQKEKRKSYFPLTKDARMSQKNKNIILIVNSGALQDEKKVPQHPSSPAQSSEDEEEATSGSDSETRPEGPLKLGFLKQGLAAFAVSLYSAAVGFTSAYTGPALVSMNQTSSTVHPTVQEASWIASLMPLSALLGGIFGGLLIEAWGRKGTIMATAFPFTVSFLMIALADNVPLIQAGRALAGFCVGVTSLGLPVYMGETLQPEVRGMFGLFPTTLGNLGILAAMVAGYYFDWRGLAYLGALIPLPSFLLMFFIPETPTWYMNKGNQKAAQRALKWLRGKDADVTTELAEISKNAQAQDEESVSMMECLRDFFKWHHMWPLSISLGLMFFQQFSGINAMIFYTVKIFKDAGSTIDSNLASVIVGLVNMAATLVATFLIDRLGRKMLLYISSLLMAITAASLGSFFYYKNVVGADVTHIGWIPLASFVVFVVGFSLGAGPIPWLMMGEILPAKIRGRAASIATGFNWTCTFIVTKTFVDLEKIIGMHGAFWIFSFICCGFLIFTIFCVMETRGKSLADIERRFRGEKVQVRNVRRMSSLAHMKVFSSNI